MQSWSWAECRDTPARSYDFAIGVREQWMEILTLLAELGREARRTHNKPLTATDENEGDAGDGVL